MTNAIEELRTYAMNVTNIHYQDILDYADAIEREIAERTCHSTTDDSAWCFVCSECGKSFPRNELHIAHNHGEINYCPNCGCKVVDA